MQDFLSIMLVPALACVVLSLMHAYLGFHIVARRVLFADLALAQLAALGATVATVMGFSAHSTVAYLSGLGFCILGSVFLSLLQYLPKNLSQEGIVGILYCFSAAFAVIVLSSSANSGEELKSLLVGHLLYTSKEELLFIIALYSSIGVLQYFLFRQFWTQSNFQNALNSHSRFTRFFWDLLFYFLFSLVVTSSVEVAGVLVVFAMLVTPAVVSQLFNLESFRERLASSWVYSVVIMLLGISASYFLDLPTGALLASAYGFSLFILLGWRIVWPIVERS